MEIEMRSKHEYNFVCKLEQVCNHVTTVERPLLASKTFHIVFACKKLVSKGKQMPRPEIVIYNLI